ncbi:MAG: TM1812 family CRISPR-associated protein, partial [Treponema sp.]|nr:TM1812 family CRISPR-associated protein [Treponema sp.]
EIEWNKPIRCPINGVLARKLQKNEKVKIIYIATTGENSEWEENEKAFKKELEDINMEIGAILDYCTIKIDFLPTKQTYNKLITELTKEIPGNSEIYTDITYGFKPETLSLFCALRFVEEFNYSTVQYIVYGKVEFHKKTGKKENPMLYDITSLYYLFKLMGTMGAVDAETATETLNEFFAI